MIAEDDAYRPLRTGEMIYPGDVAVYVRGNEVLHVGIVVDTLPAEAPEVLVLSQFGADGEYLHGAEDIPTILSLGGGPTMNIWTNRVEITT